MKQWIVNLSDVLAQKEAAERAKAQAPPQPPEPPMPPEPLEPLEPEEELSQDAPAPQVPPGPVSPPAEKPPPPQPDEVTPEEGSPSDETSETVSTQDETPSPDAASPPEDGDIPPATEIPGPEEEPPSPEPTAPPASPPSPPSETDVDLDAPLPDPEKSYHEETAPPKPPFWTKWNVHRFAGKLHWIRPWMICVLLALLGALALLQQQGQLDRLIRWYHYSNVTDVEPFDHNAQRIGVFLGHGQKLIVCTETQIQVFSPTGEVHLNETVNMTAPAVNTSKDSFVAYDAGGHELRVVKDDKVVFSLTLETGKTILSASINDAGWLAVTTKEDGYKGVVTIYDGDADYKMKMSIRMASRYLTDAVITTDCSGVYAVSPGQNTGAFESSLLYFTIPNPTTDTPIAQVSLGDSVVLNTRCTGKTCWVLGENWLSILSTDGALSQQYDYGGRYLKKASLEGDGFAAMLLSNSQSSSSGTLVTVDRKGEQIASLDINEPVATLACSGKYVAVLTASHLYLYDKELKQLSESSDILGFNSIVLFADGSMNLISEKKATLYLP